MARSLAFLCSGLARRVCVLVLMTLCAASLVAQKSNYPRSFWVGARAGANFSRMAFIPSVPQTLHQGVHGGLAFRFEVEKGASAQLELNYTQTGWTEQFADTEHSFSRMLTYVELPLLSQLYLQQGGIRVFVNLGPFIGLNVGDTYSAEGANFTDAQLIRQTSPIYYNMNWGLTGGPGVSIPLGKRQRIELEGRVLYTFSDIWSNQRVDPYGQSAELRFIGSLAYFFRL